MNETLLTLSNVTLLFLCLSLPVVVIVAMILCSIFDGISKRFDDLETRLQNKRGTHGRY